MRGFLLIFITMKHNLNEEVARMREMMGLEEQILKGLGDKLKTAWNDKVKPAAEKAGQAIQTGVHNVAQKVADVTQKQQNQQQVPQQQKKCSNPYLDCIQQEEIPQLIKDWSAVNTDMSNMQGFGTGISRDDNMAQQMAEFQARAVILNEKLKLKQASFGTKEIKRTYCDLPNGTIQYFVILEKS